MSKKGKYPKKTKKSLDSYHYHEACDRTYLTIKFIDENLLQHTVFLKHKKFKEKINDIINDLASIYQVTGALQSKKMDEEETNSKSKG